ncbi:hypothetical protein [Vibrio cholerae]|uniref:hypothetical protein n=1 Tax=Vibrio cholerae TaxID=666 RepID=UPI003016C3F6
MTKLFVVHEQTGIGFECPELDDNYTGVDGAFCFYSGILHCVKNRLIEVARLHSGSIMTGGTLAPFNDCESSVRIFETYNTKFHRYNVKASSLPLATIEGFDVFIFEITREDFCTEIFAREDASAECLSKKLHEGVSAVKESDICILEISVWARDRLSEMEIPSDLNGVSLVAIPNRKITNDTESLAFVIKTGKPTCERIIGFNQLPVGSCLGQLKVEQRCP